MRTGFSFSGWNTRADGSGTTYAQDQTFTIGDGYLQPINGKLDEFRVSGTPREAGWIKTEYNNQNNPGTGSGKFIKTVDGEETYAGSADLDQIHYRWRDDNGGESAEFDTGTGADGPVTISSSQNINTDLGGTVTAVTANPSGWRD